MKQDLIKPVSKRCESTIDKVVLQVDTGLEVLSNVPGFALLSSNYLIETLDEGLYTRLNKSTSVARLIRYGTLPWSQVILKGYKYLFSNYKQDPIFQPGIHMVRAKVGGGKSLLSYILAEIFRLKTGLGSYFTSPVEKPRITEDGLWKYVYHRVINLNDYFDENGNKIKKFNSKKHKAIHKDERHLEFNPRNNKSAEYNKKYQPQQQDEILMRHQGITHIYKYSQYMKLDSQDMQALTYMHDVETIKDIPLRKWLEDGLFNVIPLVLKVSSFVIDYSFKGEMSRKKVKTTYIEVPYEVLKYYDTHAESYRFDGIPVDYN